MKMIFVAGVHGVGKTTFCEKLSEILELSHYSAGQIINNYLNKQSTKKEVKNIKSNQDILLQAIKSLGNQNKIILDGHFTLINDSNEIEEIPISTFQEINPKIIIILYDDVDIILQRLYVRDQKKYDAELLKKLQKSEIKHGGNIAKLFKSKLLLFNSSNSDIQSIIEEVKK